MESKVKSHISNKTYLSNLDMIEEEDKDLKSELYMIPISGNKIMVAPGKSRMDENGIASCYVYVIQREKVISKLGVYEKKTDSMPLIFDISTFPEGSFCLFEEFEKNPSKLLDFVMKEEKTVFDFLIEEFPKIEDKKKTLKTAYRTLFELKSKEENKKDKEITPILKVISTASKEDSPTDAFLYTLKDAVTNEKTFIYTLLALQYIFKIEFRMNTDNGFYQDILQRWAIQDATSTIDVDIESYGIIETKESDTEPPVAAIVDLDESLSKKESIDESLPEKSDFKQEDEETTEVDQPTMEDATGDDTEDAMEETTEERKNAPSISLDLTPKPIDLDEITPGKVLDPIPESREIEEVEPSKAETKKPRKTRTPKSDSKPKAEPKSKSESKSKAESKAKSETKDSSMEVPLGTSLNMGTKPTIKVASKKIKMKSAVEKPK